MLFQVQGNPLGQLGDISSKEATMITIPKNKNDKSKSIIEREIDRIVTHFMARINKSGWAGKALPGCSENWAELYASDYVRDAIAPALEQIKQAGYYVWKIVGCFGRNCAFDTVYRITETCLKPTPGCTRV
jgi:hypothetical protein